MRFIGNGGHAKVIRGLLLTNWRRKRRGSVLAIGDNAARKREAKRHRNIRFPVLIHCKAWVAPQVKIGVGTVIMAGAVVQPGARIGRFCIINSGATVDHHCVLEDFVHIAPGAHLCGNVRIGEGALVGVGVGIEPGAVIPAWSVVKRIPYRIERCPTK